jgi:hypothetical protein
MPDDRFAFGKNWQAYLKRLDETRIEKAEVSLRVNLGNLSDQTFLDIGSGCGLFSLAARRLGANVVPSTTTRRRCGALRNCGAAPAAMTCVADYVRVGTGRGVHAATRQL